MTTLDDLLPLPATWQPASAVLHRAVQTLKIAGLNVQVGASLRVEPTQTRILIHCEAQDVSLHPTAITYVSEFLRNWGAKHGFSFSPPEPRERLRWWGSKAIVKDVPLAELVEQVDDWMDALDVSMPRVVHLPLPTRRSQLNPGARVRRRAHRRSVHAATH